jgi:hypothetical protein
MNNSSIAEAVYTADFGGFAFFIHTCLFVSELFNLVILLCAIYGMQQGIETQHPLYAVLFLNLLVPAAFTIVDIVGFPFFPLEKYFKLINANSSLSLFFHCTSWCVTSVIRFVYIEYEERIHKFMPSVKSQCVVAVAFAVVAFPFFAFPSFCYALYLGKGISSEFNQSFVAIFPFIIILAFVIPQTGNSDN